MEGLSAKLDEGWKVVEEHHLMKSYDFADFKQALAFTNRVGALAEKQGHHPDIYLSYGKVEIKIWTHKMDAVCHATKHIKESKVVQASCLQIKFT